MPTETYRNHRLTVEGATAAGAQDGWYKCKVQSPEGRSWYTIHRPSHWSALQEGRINVDRQYREGYAHNWTEEDYTRDDRADEEEYPR